MKIKLAAMYEHWGNRVCGRPPAHCAAVLAAAQCVWGAWRVQSVWRFLGDFFEDMVTGWG